MPTVAAKGASDRFESLLRKVVSSWNLGDEGKLTSKEWGISFYENALCHLMDRRRSGLSETEFENCVTRAARDLVPLGVADAGTFKAAYEKRRNEILKKKPKPYYGLVRCGFVIEGIDWLPIEFFGQRMCLSVEPPAGFDVSEFFLSGHGDIRPDQPEGGMYVLVGPVHSRSISGALERVVDHITILLGYLAFLQGYGRLSHRFGKVGPTTVFRAGEHVVLYGQDLTREQGHVSYFSHYPAEVTFISGRQSKRIIDALPYVRAETQTDKSKIEYLSCAFGEYHNAVTEPHPDYQLRQLWRLAEHLTFAERGNVDKVARRLALIWHDADLYYAVASAAGNRRNAITHQTGQELSSRRITELFRYVICSFIEVSMSLEAGPLRTWRSILEVGSSTSDTGAIVDALSFLTKISDQKASRSVT